MHAPCTKNFYGKIYLQVLFFSCTPVASETNELLHFDQN